MSNAITSRHQVLSAVCCLSDKPPWLLISIRRLEMSHKPSTEFDTQDAVARSCMLADEKQHVPFRKGVQGSLQSSIGLVIWQFAGSGRPGWAGQSRPAEVPEGCSRSRPVTDRRPLEHAMGDAMMHTAERRLAGKLMQVTGARKPTRP